LAPEETSADSRSRHLFASAPVRQNAGRTEQALILLSTEQLANAGMPIPSSPGAVPEEPAEVIARFVKAHEDQVELKTGLRDIRARRVKKFRAHTRTFNDQLKPRLLKALSNVPEAVDESETYIAPDESVTDKNFRVIRSDLERVINVADPKVRSPVRGRIKLSEAQLEKLRDAGFEDEHGKFVGVPDEVIEPILYGASDSHERKTLLLRDNPLGRVCRAKTGGEKCMDNEEAPPFEPDENGDGSEEIEAENPPRLAVSVSGLEVATDEDIPRYIAKLVDQMTAPEEAVTFGAVAMGTRADQDDVQNRIDAFSFRRGPADVPAFYDFHNLQIAFEHVWQEAIDQGVIDLAEVAYKHIVELGGDPCDPSADPFSVIPGAVVDCLPREVDNVIQALLEEPPVEVAMAFEVTKEQWSVLNVNMQNTLKNVSGQLIHVYGDIYPESAVREPTNRLRQRGSNILRYADSLLAEESSPFNQLHDILRELQHRIREPYAFTVYGANRYERSVNFGVLITYRQRWEPVTYQAGELVKTITLAPKEVRKFSKKTVLKRTRAHKEVENSLASRREEAGATSRVEAEIVRNAQAKTNFSLTAQGSYNIGISEGKQTTKFGGDAAKTSNEVKNEFREAVVKSAQEYKDERKVEVSTEETFEEEMTESGEIMNPNDELPVTFLFYELQRRFRVSEHIHRLLPVILVAQEVPTPQEINEEWLIAHGWILRRFLLDDSFLPALSYLSTSVVGEEFALKEMRKNVDQQRKLTNELKEEVVAYRELAGDRYTALERAIERSAKAAEKGSSGGLFGPIGDLIPGTRLVEKGVDFLAGDGDKSPEAAQIRERAARDAYEKALQEERDLMARLNREITALNAMTEAYTRALSEHLNRKTEISRLRVHVKQNILHYMQAIWLMEPPDQRFFRLHKVQVPIFEKKGQSSYSISGSPTHKAIYTSETKVAWHEFTVTTQIDPEFDTASLVEVADLDNLLGFKGNYMMFPLKKSNPLTDFMMAPYLDQEWELYDPDVAGNMTLDEFSEYVCCLKKELSLEEFERVKPDLRELFDELLTSPMRNNEEIVVPTDSLFIEALPGVHPILEDFKLIHRAIDVKKVQAEVRQQEIDNIRRAARILKGELEDPDIEAKYVFEGDGTATIVPPAAGGGNT
jgi:hypothetical protein